jgi:anti-sigma-K factor RskA
MDVHDLTPAYALHALDAEEREHYESHLAQCDRCREELALLQESASALAWAVESPAPPAGLRDRILDGARGDNVVPLRPRRWQAIAAIAACVAVGLGIWAATLNSTLHHERASAAQVVPLQGRAGMVAVDRNRDAVLVVDKLPAAPAGMTYEAWVIPKGDAPHAAGTFAGDGGMAMVHLGMKVPRGAVVAATLEHAKVAQPTSQPIFEAQT